MSKRPPYALLFVTCVILAGCDRCSKEQPTATDQASAPADSGQATEPAATPADQPATAPQPDASAPTPATGAETTELKIEDLKVGTGAVAELGKKVTVNYTGTLIDGTKFDSTKDRGTPFPFTLGSGMVIAGWEQGVKGMKEGGTRKLTVPPALAYGNRSVGGVIPPNSTLIFEIELVKVE